MDNHEWVYFLTIAEEGALTKAAQKLFVSQPALSQFLNKLEKKLEVKLFERQKNNALVLTPAGVRYRRYCEEALRLWESACRDMHRQDTKPSVVLGMYSMKFEKRMDEFCRSRPDMSQVMVRRVLAADMPQKLLSGEIQIAFGSYLGEHPKLEYRCLLCREMDLVVPWEHPLAAKSYRISGNEAVRINISEAKDLPFVLLKEPLVWRFRADRYFEKMGFTPNVAMEVLTDDQLWHAAATQHLATFYRHNFQGGELPAGMVPVALDPPMYFTSGVFYRKDLELTPMLMQLIERYCAYYFE